MNALAFDTLAFSKKLQNAGLERNIADAISDAQYEAMKNVFASQGLASKSDLQDAHSELKTEIQDVRNEIQAVRSELKTEIQAVRNELKEEIQGVRSELKTEIQGVRNEIADTKHEILKWVLGIALAQTAVILSVIGLAVAVMIK